MQSRLAVGRITGLLVAFIAFGISIHCTRACVRMNNEFHQWFEDRPMELVVDLSKPGEFTAPFRQTCSISHGEVVLLELQPSSDHDRRPEEVLHSLAAHVVIKTPDGTVIETAKVNSSKIRQEPDSDAIILTGFAPFSKGDYIATIHVDSGVPELVDKRQLLYVKYQLCGLEQFPALVAGMFAAGAGLCGFVAAVAVLPGLLRYGCRRAIGQY